MYALNTSSVQNPNTAKFDSSSSEFTVVTGAVSLVAGALAPVEIGSSEDRIVRKNSLVDRGWRLADLRKEVLTDSILPDSRDWLECEVCC
jgi:hypothetical protein